MADVLFDIEVTGIKELRDAAANFERLGKVSSKLAAQYKPLGAQTTRLIKEQKRLEAVKKALAKAVDQERIDIVQANRAMEEELRVSRERILTDKKLIASARNRAKEEEKSRKETERLTKAYAPARVAADLYQKKLKEIDKAAKRGIISQKEAARAAGVVAREFKQFTEGVATGGNQFAKFNVEAYKSAQTLKRRFNTGLQQAGFQFGDFAVQVQSGTNVAVAFGQQMSQLLGIFGAGGALAGAGVAIGTAFIAPMIEMRKEAKGLKDNLNEVFSTLEDNKATSAELINMSFTGPLEESRLKALEVLKVFEEIDKNAARQQVARGALGLIGQLENLSEDARVKASGNLLGMGKAKTEERRTAAGQLANEIDALIVTLGQAAVGPVEGLEDRLQDVFLQIEKLGFGSDKFKKDFKSLITDAGVLDTVTERLRNAQEDRNKKLEQEKEFLDETIAIRDRELKELEKLNNVEKLRNKIEKERLNNFRRAEAIIVRIRQQRRKAQEAEEAREQARIELENARKIEKLEAARAKTIKERFNAIMKEIEANEKAIAKEQEAQQKINTSASERLILLKQQNRVLELQTKYGKDSEEALETQKTFTLLNLKNSLEKQGVDREIVKALLEQQEALIVNKQLLADSLNISKEIKQALSPVEAQYLLSKGILPPQAAEDFKVVNQVEKEFLSNKRAAARKKAEDAAKAYAKALEEQRRITEAFQKELDDVFGNSLANAMMSIVDGTNTVKDAFKQMAAEIIKDLYRILVVEQLVASFKAVTGPFTSLMSGPFVAGMSADGNAFSRGNRITAYANGGVVGGPTYFPMSGNRVGLMGEAGPEAIMPLSRGKDGKLGVQASGQGVTVNQNINISTGVQQTVRTEIKSLMPQIAEASKAAVADAKRRGGSYGRTFS